MLESPPGRRSGSSSGVFVFAELGRRGYKLARQIVIAVIGGTVVIAGVIMLVTPGPALVFIPLGLGILAIEFAWARQWLNKLKGNLSRERLNSFLDAKRNSDAKRPPPAE